MSPSAIRKSAPKSVIMLQAEPENRRLYQLAPMKPTLHLGPAHLRTGYCGCPALPKYRLGNKKERSIVLVPKDIVRALPVANDWSDLSAAIDANQTIRAKVNAFLSGIAQPTVKERKEAIKSAALSSADVFEAFVAAMKEHATYYDPNIDALGYYTLRKILNSNPDKYKVDTKYKIKDGISEIVRVVHDTLEMFSHHVENGNLWEELWVGDKPKKERAAQLIYYAISDCFCKANDVDISPEANMGGGPIDFKYSKGYNARILVEMKRSSGSVVHGYEKQLEIYKSAAKTTHGIFVIIDYGDLGDKLDVITKIRNERIHAGEQASEIFVIDARKKQSASKRK